MKPVHTLTLVDPVFKGPMLYNAMDRFWLKRIRDERDLPFVYLTLQILFVMIPLGVLLFIPFITGWVWWAVAVSYSVLNNFVFKGPFGLMLHCTSHRPWFNDNNKLLNHYLLPWFVSPFFGQTPETYASHHLAMHHRENNLEDDLSSTMHYQRDSFRGFMAYFGDFFFRAVAKLAVYFHRREQRKLRNKVIRGELTFLALCIGLSFVDWPATLVAFILPFLISRFIMMLGNWAQHAFVDPKDPGNFYKNSITCINTKYNIKCWNDGYHISHHIKPNMHWTLHPDHLKENIDDYVANKALVFEGIHFLHVWWYLMTKNYGKLASRLVNLNGMFASKDEAIVVMKARTISIPKEG